MLRHIRVTRRSAAQLLDQSGNASAHSLSQLVAAATAPASHSELAGEHTAVTLFRAARLSAAAPIPRTRRRSMIKSAVAKLVAGKFLAAGAVAAAATGGVALAAVTGNFPNPRPAIPSNTSAPASAGSSSHSSPVSSVTSATRPSRGNPTTSRPSATASSSTPKPSLTGLCLAYQAGVTSNPGSALQNPAFTALVTAAGGQSNVSPYCVTLIGAPASHPAGAPAGRSAGAPASHRASHPAGAPTGQSAGAPASHRASHPSGAPASHPSGPSAGH